jgi:hypothetical protein
MAELSLGDALRIGKALVSSPHSSHIENCGIGMVYAAHAVASKECGTVVLIYPALGKIWICPWCEGADCVLQGSVVLQHPFMLHYLTGQISLEDLAQWLDFIATDPHWNELQARYKTMPRFPLVEPKEAQRTHEGHPVLAGQ